MSWPRMTTRGWLLCIVAGAIICAGIRAALWHQRWSPLRTRAGLHASSEAYARGQHDHFAALFRRFESNPRAEPLTVEELENCRRAVREWAIRAEWYGLLRREDERAAAHPWEPVGPDPPRQW